MTARNNAVADVPTDRIFGIRVSPITRRRLANYRANTRGYWSGWIFLALP